MADYLSDDKTDGGLVARQADGDNAQAYSNSEIPNLLKRTVEDGFVLLRLRGELAGVKRAGSGSIRACWV